MLIDANMMLGGTYMLPHGISESHASLVLQYYGIGQAIVYHAEARNYDVISGNRRLIDFTNAHKDFLPCLVLSPGYKSQTGSFDNAAQMIKENYIKFIRIFPSVHGYAFESGLTDELFCFAEENKVVMMLDMQETFSYDGHPAKYFEELCRKHAGLPVILTRCVHRKKYSIGYYLENLSNVYIDPSIMNNWLFYEETVMKYGSERLVWGSSMPFNNAGCSVSMLAYADISSEDRKRISGQNILDLLQREKQ